MATKNARKAGRAAKRIGARTRKPVPQTAAVGRRRDDDDDSGYLGAAIAGAVMGSAFGSTPSRSEPAPDPITPGGGDFGGGGGGGE